MRALILEADSHPQVERRWWQVMIWIVSQRMPDLSKRRVQVVNAAVMVLSCFLHIGSWVVPHRRRQKKNREGVVPACALHVLHVSCICLV